MYINLTQQVVRRVLVTRDFKTMFKYSSTKHLAMMAIAVNEKEQKKKKHEN